MLRCGALVLARDTARRRYPGMPCLGTQVMVSRRPHVFFTRDGRPRGDRTGRVSPIPEAPASATSWSETWSETPAETCRPLWLAEDLPDHVGDGLRHRAEQPPRGVGALLDGHERPRLLRLDGEAGADRLPALVQGAQERPGGRPASLARTLDRAPPHQPAPPLADPPPDAASLQLGLDLVILDAGILP